MSIRPSAFLLGRFLYDMSLKNGNVPYVTFDQTGLLVYDERRLRWGSIDHMETSIQSSTYGSSHDYGHGSVITMQTVNTEILSLVDEFGATLFSVYANDPFLPISINQFKALVGHYMAMYGKEAKAKN
jgi:hypothetical protein